MAGPTQHGSPQSGTTTLSAALKKPVSPGPWGGVGMGQKAWTSQVAVGQGGDQARPFATRAYHITHPGPAQELTHTQMHTVH